MSATVRVAAVDLGASSGRVMVGDVGADRLDLHAVSRFPHGPVRLGDGLHWDVVGLWSEVLSGLREATRVTSGSLASTGIDSWAVDYGLLRDGRLLGIPFCYRDERRGEEGPARVSAVVDPAALYQRNGLQFLPFNTVYQLAADPWLELADRVLLVPDLLGYWLTGRELAERTNASTTGLLDVRSGAWDLELASRLGHDATLLPELVDPGTTLGPSRAALGLDGLPVVAVGSHDTASAVVAVPMESGAAAYVSLGTWGLVGLELDEPVLTEESRLAGFTHEGGVDGTIRYLTNVMGTWLLSETLRAWGRDDLTDLLAAAGEVRGAPVFDVQDARFLPPGNMPDRIAAWCDEHGVRPPEGQVEMVRSIVDSLAEALADAVARASRLAGRVVEVVHVVGGGAQNALLCQELSDRAGLPVEAGPVEATALGNVLVQARAAGADLPDLAAMRDLVRRTHDLRRFTPRPDDRIHDGVTS